MWVFEFLGPELLHKLTGKGIHHRNLLAPILLGKWSGPPCRNKLFQKTNGYAPPSPLSGQIFHPHSVTSRSNQLLPQ